MPNHFADRLTAAIRAKGNALCVGLDPRWDSLPEEIRERHGGETLAAMAAAFEEFCGRVMDAVAPLVPVVKPQSAFFEACGPDGLAAPAAAPATGPRAGSADHPRRQAQRHRLDRRGLRRRRVRRDRTLARPASRLGRRRPDDQPVPGPRRRGAVFEKRPPPAAGRVRAGADQQPGRGQFQDLDCDGRPLFLHVAEAVATGRGRTWGVRLGRRGGRRRRDHPAELAALRRLLPEVIFLIPGFGAQGGTAADTAAAFRATAWARSSTAPAASSFAFKPRIPRWEDAERKWRRGPLSRHWPTQRRWARLSQRLDLQILACTSGKPVTCHAARTSRNR